MQRFSRSLRSFLLIIVRQGIFACTTTDAALKDEVYARGRSLERITPARPVREDPDVSGVAFHPQ